MVVKTKPKEVFDVGINASHDDDDDEVDTYLENVPYNITTDDACDVANDSHAWAQVNEKWTIYEQNFIDDEELSHDVYESNDDDSNDDECS